MAVFTDFSTLILLTKECKKYIEDSEKRGYELALINAGGGRYDMSLCSDTAIKNN
jgi:hypothetical protein